MKIAYKPISQQRSKTLQYLAISYVATTLVLGTALVGQKIQMSRLAGRYLEAVNHINGLTNMINYQWEQANKPKTTSKSVEDMIDEVFGYQAPTMKKIARCESGLNPKAQNKNSSATGVFQVLSKLHGIEKKWLVIPEINLAVAKRILDTQGLSAWNASKHCWSR